MSLFSDILNNQKSFKHLYNKDIRDTSIELKIEIKNNKIENIILGTGHIHQQRKNSYIKFSNGKC